MKFQNIMSQFGHPRVLQLLFILLERKKNNNIVTIYAVKYLMFIYIKKNKHQIVQNIHEYIKC